MRLFFLLLVLVSVSSSAWSQRFLSSEELRVLTQTLTELEELLTQQASQLDELKTSLKKAQDESMSLARQLAELKSLSAERETYWAQVVSRLETERNFAIFLGVVGVAASVVIAIVK